MDTLVDIFYYDYILTKIIEMYHENVPLPTLVPYLKIATVMSKKFRDEKIPMDKQVYTKEVYVKVIQVIKYCISVSPRDPKSQGKLIDCIKGVTHEFPELETDEEFVVVRNVAFVLYLHLDAEENGTANKNSYVEYINKTNEGLKKEQREQFVRLNGDLRETELLEYLQTISLGSPAMRKFALSIKGDIDEKEQITKRDSIGEKVNW